MSLCHSGVESAVLYAAAGQVPGTRIAIMGGTFVNDALFLREGLLAEPFTVETDLGTSPPIYPGRANGVPFYYIPMHGSSALQAAWVALYDLGVTEVLGGATAGGINVSMQPYDYVVPDDFIDLNIDRPLRFLRQIYRDPDNIPLPRVLPAMDPDLRQILIAKTRERIRQDVANDDMDLHARMLGMNYACLIAISNPAEGVAPWDFAEMPPLYRRMNPVSVDILMDALPDIAALKGKPRAGDSLIFHPKMSSKEDGAR